jgi:Ca2+-binding EF-hand superfamily protein
VGELLFRRLDADGDGKLTQAELRRAPQALRKFDLNEDEFLDLTELLAFAGLGSRPGVIRAKVDEAGEASDVKLRLDVGAKAQAPIIEGKSAKSIRLVPASAPNGLHRLTSAEGHWSITFRTRKTVPDVRSASEFLVSQFKTALGDRSALTKADLEQDPTLSGLLELFRYADRNADNQLSLVELEDYLKLVELGMRAQIWIKVSDRGWNPFHVLDADGDERLSYQELAQAPNLLAGDAPEAKGLPEQFQLTFGGPVVASWGGVPIPAIVKRPRSGTPGAPKGPRWFQAMDRNGDGVVSPREFVGPPEVFQKLDANGDGVISAEEAARAEGR